MGELVGDFAEEHEERLGGSGAEAHVPAGGAMVGDEGEECGGGVGGGIGDVLDNEFGGPGDGGGDVAEEEVALDGAVAFGDVAAGFFAAEDGDAFPVELGAIECAGVRGGPGAVEASDGGLIGVGEGANGQCAAAAVDGRDGELGFAGDAGELVAGAAIEADGRRVERGDGATGGALLAEHGVQESGGVSSAAGVGGGGDERDADGGNGPAAEEVAAGDEGEAGDDAVVVLEDAEVFATDLVEVTWEEVGGRAEGFGGDAYDGVEVVVAGGGEVLGAGGGWERRVGHGRECIAIWRGVGA